MVARDGGGNWSLMPGVDRLTSNKMMEMSYINDCKKPWWTTMNNLLSSA